jgi:hypothetical protein
VRCCCRSLLLDRIKGVARRGHPLLGELRVRLILMPHLPGLVDLVADLFGLNRKIVNFEKPMVPHDGWSLLPSAREERWQRAIQRISRINPRRRPLKPKYEIATTIIADGASLRRMAGFAPASYPNDMINGHSLEVLSWHTLRPYHS